MNQVNRFGNVVGSKTTFTAGVVLALLVSSVATAGDDIGVATSDYHCTTKKAVWIQADDGRKVGFSGAIKPPPDLAGFDIRISRMDQSKRTFYDTDTHKQEPCFTGAQIDGLQKSSDPTVMVKKIWFISQCLAVSELAVNPKTDTHPLKFYSIGLGWYRNSVFLADGFTIYGNNRSANRQFNWFQDDTHGGHVFLNGNCVAMK